MKRISIILIGVFSLFLCSTTFSAEKLAYLSKSSHVANLYFYDPADNNIDTITDYPLTDVLAYDFSGDGSLLVTAVKNPVSEEKQGIKLVTRNYPYYQEEILMTYFSPTLQELRQQYSLDVSTDGRYIACVDSVGLMVIDRELDEIQYLLTHNRDPEAEFCEAYLNWGGEFSPDGKHICIQSYCIADKIRLDVHSFESREYRRIHELEEINSFSWLPGSDGIILSTSACGGPSGIYIADMSPLRTLIGLETCNMANACCNKFFDDYYSDFHYAQAYDGGNKIITFAKGVKLDGTRLNDVYIIDQEKQVITKVVSADVIELKLSPSERFLALITNSNPTQKYGSIFLYDFKTNQGDYILDEDNSCSQIMWLEVD